MQRIYQEESGYLQLLDDVLQYGEAVQDRTGVGTVATTVPTTVDFSLWWGLPVLTTKQTFWKGAIAELIWMARGSTNVYDLSEILYGDRNKPNFWTPNYEKQAKDLGYTDGELGPVYGKQLTDFYGVNQIQYVIDTLKADLFSRRAMIDMWNPADLPKMALPPCHYSTVFNVRDIGVELMLDMTVVMRSNDLFLGAPFNYVFYATLCHCIAEAVGHGLVPGVYSHMAINSHVYLNQLNQVKEQITRDPGELPELVISKRARALLRDKGAAAFHEITLEDFELVGYNPQSKLTAPMAV